MRIESVSPADSALIGRTAEWRSVSDFLDTGLRDGGALIISGELGSGKTAMLTAARADARTRGALVLHAAGSASQHTDGHVALGRLLGPVRDHFGVLPPSL